MFDAYEKFHAYENVYEKNRWANISRGDKVPGNVYTITQRVMAYNSYNRILERTCLHGETVYQNEGTHSSP